MNRIVSVVAAALLLLVSGCKFQKKTAPKGDIFVPLFQPGPHAILYKTKANYSNLVPVGMNDSGTRIVSYPAVQDVATMLLGHSVQPIAMRKHYLLDNFGIGPNSAYLDITWEQYSKYNEINADILLKHVKFTKPFLVMYDCGLKTDIEKLEKQLNRLIKDRQLEKKLKKLL